MKRLGSSSSSSSNPMDRMITNNKKTGYFLRSLLITELARVPYIEGVEERVELQIASVEDNHEEGVRRSSSERLLPRCSSTATLVFFSLFDRVGGRQETTRTTSSSNGYFSCFPFLV